MAGALDEETGDLRLDEPEVVVGRRTRQGDLPSKLDATIDGQPFAVELEWNGDALARIVLMIRDPEIAGTGWDSYPIDRNRDWNDEWVKAHAPAGSAAPWLPSATHPYGGIEHEYRWGKVGSYCYPQDMTAQIAITYGRRPMASLWRMLTGWISSAGEKPSTRPKK